MPADQRVRVQVQTAGVQKAVSGLNSISTAAKGVAAAVGTIAVGRVITGAIRLYRDFGLEIAKIQAISGSTAKEMAALRNEAERLGATTVFTAREAAEGMVILSRAGLTAAETLKTTGNVLNFAQAQAISLSDAAEQVTDTMRAARLSVEQATKVVDVLTKVANSASLNVGQLREAMKNSLSVSTSLGLSIESLSAVLGVLANSGIKGSRAGTALRRIFITILKPTSEVEQAFKSAGVSIETLQNALKTDNIEAFLKELQKLGGLFEDLRFAFTARAITAANILTAAGAPEQVAALADNLRNAENAAGKMAETLGNTLFGALKSLNSAWEGLQITIVREFEPALKNIILLTGGVISAAGEKRKAFIENNKVSARLATTIEVVATALKAAAAAASVFLISFSVGKLIVLAKAMRGVAAAAIAFRLSMTGIISVLTGATVVLAEAIPAFGRFLKVLFEVVTFQTPISDFAKRFRELAAAGKKLEETSKVIEEVGKAAETARPKIRTLSEDTKDLIQALELAGQGGVAEGLRRGLFSEEDSLAYLRAATVYHDALDAANRGQDQLSKSLLESSRSLEDHREQMDLAVQGFHELYDVIGLIQDEQEKLDRQMAEGVITIREHARGAEKLAHDFGNVIKQQQALQEQYAESKLAAEKSLQSQIDFANRLVSALREVFSLIENIQKVSEKREEIGQDIQTIRNQRAELQQKRAAERDRRSPDRAALAQYDSKISELLIREQQLAYRRDTQYSSIRAIRDTGTRALGVASNLAGGLLSKQKVAQLSESFFGRLALAASGRRFQTGGIVPGRMGQPVPAVLHGGEAVFNPRQIDRLSNLFYEQNRSFQARSGGGKPNINFRIVNQSSSPVTASAKQTSEGRYEGDSDITVVLKDLIRAEADSGALDDAMRRRYDVNQRGE